jgi:hypothetical protein
MHAVEVQAKFRYENLKKGRPRSRLDDNIKMGLREIRWKSVDRIRLVQDRDQWRAHVNTAAKLRVA